jgi:hypothetical protein
MRKDRKDGYGGVLIGVRGDLTCEEIRHNINTESVYCKIDLQGNKSLLVGAIYRPPNTGTDYMDELCEEMYTIRSRFNKSVTWIGGDFNLPDIKWDTNTINGNSNTAAVNHRLLDTISNAGLEQQVNFPTRNEATLDLFFTNRPSLVEKCSPLPGIGDHDIVMVKTSVIAKRSKPTRRKIYLWKRADLDKMNEEAEEFARQFTSRHNVNSNINIMRALRRYKKIVYHLR